MMESPADEFRRRARQGTRANLLQELWGFLRANRKWWLLPILLVMLMVGALMFLGGTAAAPFIYTLF
jgi:hypothetical protein